MDWNDKHFQENPGCRCVYCAACREIERLKDELSGKVKWAYFLKADLSTALNQRDILQGAMGDIKQSLGLDPYADPWDVAYRVRRLKEYSESSCYCCKSSCQDGCRCAPPEKEGEE